MRYSNQTYSDLSHIVKQTGSKYHLIIKYIMNYLDGRNTNLQL